MAKRWEFRIREDGKLALLSQESTLQPSSPLGTIIVSEEQDRLLIQDHSVHKPLKRLFMRACQDPSDIVAADVHVLLQDLVDQIVLQAKELKKRSTAARKRGGAG